VKIKQTRFFFLLALLLVPLAFSHAATTVYTGTGSASALYASVPVVADDVLYISSDWQQLGTCSSTGSGGTLYVKQSNLSATTTLPNAKAQGPGATGCSSSVQHVLTATTTATYDFYSEAQYSTPSTASMYIMKFSADSGGSSATTTVELPASANAANNMLTFFLAFCIFVISALFVMYLVKRFTD